MGANLSLISSRLPGVLLAFFLGYLALVAGEQAQEKTQLVSDVVIAILLGVLILNAPTGRLLGLTQDDETQNRWQSGIAFTDKRLLRLAIILMGFKVQAELFNAKDALVVLSILLIALPASFLLIGFAARKLGLTQGMGDLLGIGTMICGASAINALSPVIKAEKRDQGIAISAVFLFSIFALLAFAPLANAIDLSPEYSGLWAGLAVNDLSSSVAVGSQFGDDAEILAAAAKSVRILLLGPLLILFSMARSTGENAEKNRWFHHLPLFIVGYLLCFGLRVAGDAHFGDQTGWINFLDWNSDVVKMLILTVCAGIGMQIRIQTLVSVGWRAALAGGLGSLGLAGLSVGMLFCLENHGWPSALGVGAGALLGAYLLTRIQRDRQAA